MKGEAGPIAHTPSLSVACIKSRFKTSVISFPLHFMNSQLPSSRPCFHCRPLSQHWHHTIHHSHWKTQLIAIPTNMTAPAPRLWGEIQHFLIMKSLVGDTGTNPIPHAFCTGPCSRELNIKDLPPSSPSSKENRVQALLLPCGHMCCIDCWPSWCDTEEHSGNYHERKCIVQGCEAPLTIFDGCDCEVQPVYLPKVPTSGSSEPSSEKNKQVEAARPAWEPSSWEDELHTIYRDRTQPQSSVISSLLSPRRHDWVPLTIPEKWRRWFGEILDRRCHDCELIDYQRSGDEEDTFWENIYGDLSGPGYGWMSIDFVEKLAERGQQLMMDRKLKEGT